MNAQAPYDTVGGILDVHAMVSGLIAQAVEDVPEARMTEQPGGVVNHPAWTLSHLNAYAATLLALLDDPGAPAADAEMTQYGYGTTPVPDPAAYAPKRELLDRFNDRNARLAALVGERHVEYFPKPAPAQFQPHAATIGHIAVTLLVAHPADHFGQLRRWRRAAGIVSGV